MSSKAPHDLAANLRAICEHLRSLPHRLERGENDLSLGDEAASYLMKAINEGAFAGSKWYVFKHEFKRALDEEDIPALAFLFIMLWLREHANELSIVFNWEGDDNGPGQINALTLLADLIEREATVLADAPIVDDGSAKSAASRAAKLSPDAGVKVGTGQSGPPADMPDDNASGDLPQNPASNTASPNMEGDQAAIDQNDLRILRVMARKPQLVMTQEQVSAASAGTADKVGRKTIGKRWPHLDQCGFIGKVKNRPGRRITKQGLAVLKVTTETTPVAPIAAKRQKCRPLKPPS